MKSCELCKSTAKVFCDSDQASLCWTCDATVHSANFLVARHARTLLCRVCSSPTPWTASGVKLGPSALSICEICVVDVVDATSGEDDAREDGLGGNDEDEYDGDEDSENEVEIQVAVHDEYDNQVVPLSNLALCYTPPPAASSSSCDNYSVGDRRVLAKRKRQNVADLLSEDDIDCISAQKQKHHGAACTTELSEAGDRRTTLYHFLPLISEAMGDKQNIFKQKISGDNKPAPVAGVCNGITRAVGLDLNSSESS